jgi:hypothetical protein
LLSIVAEEVHPVLLIELPEADPATPLPRLIGAAVMPVAANVALVLVCVPRAPVKSHFTRSAACKAKGISELARKQDTKRLRLLVAELMSFGCFMAVTQLVIDNEFWSTEQK